MKKRFLRLIANFQQVRGVKEVKMRQESKKTDLNKQKLKTSKVRKYIKSLVSRSERIKFFEVFDQR